MSFEIRVRPTTSFKSHCSGHAQTAHFCRGRGTQHICHNTVSAAASEQAVGSEERRLRTPSSISVASVERRSRTPETANVAGDCFRGIWAGTVVV